MNKKNLVYLVALILIFTCPSQNIFAYNNQYISREDSLVKDIQPFNKYGLIYNKEEDTVYYNGQLVKAFVDFKEPNWSFNIGYIDSNVDSGLYLVTVHNDDGNVIEIEEMSEELIQNLYENVKTPKMNKEKLASITKEIQNSRECLKNYKKENTDKYVYHTFDATTILSDSSIVITDKLDDLDIPDSVEQLVFDYSNTKKAALIVFENNNNINAWFCYGGDSRLAWNAKADEDTLKLYLFDAENNNTDRTYTLIHYEAPVDYKNLKVYINDDELELDKLIYQHWN